jgi:hypothetical protein
VGHGLSQDRGALGNHGLCSFSFPASSKARSLLPLCHELTGAVGQRSKEANQSGGVVLWRRCCREAFILVFEPDG